MRNRSNIPIFQSACRAIVLALTFSSVSLEAAIRSDFDDGIYPGEAGNGWVAGWSHTAGGAPEITSDLPMDGKTPYLRLNLADATGRNVARQYASGGGVDVNLPLAIEWKFRLNEDDFAGNFSTFNDRVHFFARNAPRLQASTDANNTWAIMAAGDAHSSGAAAGKTFWVYDNVTGGSEFNLENTSEGPAVIFDSGGFEDEAIYPIGPLGPVSINDSTWAPGGVPGEIVSSEDAQRKKVLRRSQAGTDNIDTLNFPGVTSGILTVRFDARASMTTARTVDVMLLPATGSQMASMLGWGINSGKVAYYDGNAWVSAFDLDTGWHTFEMINYLSGALARTFDLKIDGVYVGRGLPWRNAIAAGTPLSRLRIGAIRGPEGEYAEIDNLVLSTEAEPLPPPVIVDIRPAHRAHFYPAGDGLRFGVTSDDPIPSGGITLRLNGTDVSAALLVSGSVTNRTVLYTNLQPDLVYTAEIGVANALGENSAVIQFNTITQPTSIVDVDGFDSTTLYPAGPLKPGDDDYGTWTPGRTGDPGEIVSLPEANRGKVLRRAQTGMENIDILDFTPLNSGVLTIEFDARVSTTGGRTLDVALKRTGQNQRASWLAWGEVPGRIAYHNAGAWTDVADLDDQWHRYRISSYLDGPRAHRFDLFIDGTLIAEQLGWSQGFATGEFFGRLRIGAAGGSAGDFADLDNLVVSLSPPPPAITGLVPGALTLFHPAGDGFRFQVNSPSALPSGAVKVTLNGVDVSPALELAGQSGQWSVVYAGLKPNMFYTAEISVTGATGTAQATHSFATFSAQAVVEIEAEDYNYESGRFQDDPPPSGYLPNGTLVNGGGAGYVDLQGTAAVDYFKGTAAGGDPQQSYRFLDSTGTRHTSDLQRPKYATANVPDYEVWDFQTGDWMNYTRSFPTGEYQVFLRAASPAAQTARLDRVGSDRAQPNQQTSALGMFLIPDSGAAFAYVPLTDDQGRPKLLSLAGVQTLRVHAANAGSGLQLNFVVFVAAPPAVNDIVLANPSFAAGSFSVSFQTESGRTYVVEYKNSLTLPAWSVLQTVAGDGTVKTVSDQNPADNQRFYRVRSQ